MSAAAGGAPGVAADPFLAGIRASELLWERLQRPLDHAAAFEALLGTPQQSLAPLARLLVAGGPESEALLDGMDDTVRVLRNASGTRRERLRGEVRGPIVWGETLSARASSHGADDLYVCATPFRDFDVAENRVLAHVLAEIVRAGDEVHHMPDDLRDGQLGRRALANRERARRALTHRGLCDARRGRPSARDVGRARRSRDLAVYLPALDALERVEDPVRIADVLPFVDRRTRVQHGLVLAVADELARWGVELPPFVVEEGALRAGPLAYRHSRVEASARTGPHGLMVGEFLLDVPLRLRERDPVVARAALERRSGGRPCAVVLSVEEVPAVVAAALVSTG